METLNLKLCSHCKNGVFEDLNKCPAVTECFSQNLKHFTNAQKVQLYFAFASTGQFEEFSILFNYPSEINFFNLFDSKRRSCLSLAIHKGNGCTAIVKTILQSKNCKKAYINHTDNFACSALFYAVKKGFSEIVLLLLRSGASLKAPRNYNKNSLLHIAAKAGNLSVVELLLDAGVDIEKKNSMNQTSIFLAAEYSSLALVKLFAERGSNLNGVDAMQMPLWKTAILNKNILNANEIFFYLLDKTKVDIINSRHVETALREAVSAENIKIVQFLIEAGVVYSPKVSLNGKEYFNCAALNKDNVNLLQVLLDKFPHAYNNTNLLHVAADSSYNCLQHLLKDSKYLSMINQLGDDGLTPLTKSCNRLQIESVELLLLKGADANLLDSKGFSPLGRYLDLAYVGAGMFRIIRFLVDAGCNTNQLTSSRFYEQAVSPLHLCLLNCPLHVKFLWLAGARISKLHLNLFDAFNRDNVTDTHYMPAVTYLKEKLNNTCSLFESCRLVIRKYLRTPLLLSITELRLPSVIEQYLNLSEWDELEENYINNEVKSYDVIEPYKFIGSDTDSSVST